MNKQKYLLTTLSLFIMLPSITYAECTSEEIKHFKEIEDEYKVTYEFNIDNQRYNLMFYANETYDYVFDIKFEEETTCEEKDKNTIVCYNVIPSKYKVSIVGNTNTCNDTLKTINLTLAKYNPYYQDSICDGIEDFVLCQETYDKDIDYETFKSRVNIYKKNLQKKEKEIKNVEGKDNAINQYIKNNIIQIIITAVFTIAIIVTTVLTIKSSKKSRRLG